jgi:hypothetical protein
MCPGTAKRGMNYTPEMHLLLYGLPSYSGDDTIGKIVRNILFNLAKVLKDVSTAKEVNRQCDSFIFPICGI